MKALEACHDLNTKNFLTHIKAAGNVQRVKSAFLFGFQLGLIGHLSCVCVCISTFCLILFKIG